MKKQKNNKNVEQDNETEIHKPEFTAEEIQIHKEQREIFHYAPYSQQYIYNEPGVCVKAQELNLLFGIWAELRRVNINLMALMNQQPAASPEQYNPEQEEENTIIH